MKFKITFTGLIIFLLYSSVDGQVKYPLNCKESPYIISSAKDTTYNGYSSMLDDELEEKDIKQDFHETVRSIHSPSTISAFTNYKGHNLGFQKKPFIMDADLNLPIDIPTSANLGYSTLHIIPRFKVRIFNNDPEAHNGIGDRSQPVRTPSAMPGVAWYWSPKGWWSQQNFGNILHQKYLGIYAYHHSNGQDGLEIDTLNNLINTYNGNFGEQIVFEFNFSGRLTSPRDDSVFFGKQKEVKYKLGEVFQKVHAHHFEFHYRLGFEIHPSKLPFFKFSPTNVMFDDLDIYSRYRLNLRLNLLKFNHISEWICDGSLWCQYTAEDDYERFRHELQISYALDGDYKRGEFLNELEEIPFLNINRRLNINYTFYLIPQKQRNFAFFGQIGYFGNDEYNIYFNNSYFNLRAGIAFAYFDLPKLTNLSKQLRL